MKRFTRWRGKHAGEEKKEGFVCGEVKTYCCNAKLYIWLSMAFNSHAERWIVEAWLD